MVTPVIDFVRAMARLREVAPETGYSDRLTVWMLARVLAGPGSSDAMLAVADGLAELADWGGMFVPQAVKPDELRRLAQVFRDEAPVRAGSV